MTQISISYSNSRGTLVDRQTTQVEELLEACDYATDGALAYRHCLAGGLASLSARRLRRSGRGNICSALLLDPW